MSQDLSINIGSLQLKNPIMLASGTVGYGNEISQYTDLSRIGAIVTKSVSLKPRKGNPPPRITETPSGMLNAIGLANVGVEKFIEEKLPFLEKLESKLTNNHSTLIDNQSTRRSPIVENSLQITPK